MFSSEPELPTVTSGPIPRTRAFASSRCIALVRSTPSALGSATEPSPSATVRFSSGFGSALMLTTTAYSPNSRLWRRTSACTCWPRAETRSKGTGE
jgi:hypothetical protein